MPNSDSAMHSIAGLWRWFVGFGCVLLGSIFAYALHFQNWRWAQVAVLAGVMSIVGGIALLSTTGGYGKEHSNQADSGKWLIRLVFVAGIGMGIVVLYAIQYQHWVLERVGSFVGISLMTAGAAWLVGALLGFIFGVPHTRENASTEDRYRPGTSLEEISDWLTKMIVGVGLTQLGNIPIKLGALASYIAQGMVSNAVGSNYSNTHALDVNRVFALAVCIYFSVDGFLFGFLWARLYLIRAYRDADLAKEVNKAVAAASSAEEARLAADMTYQVIKARDLNRNIEKMKAIDDMDVDARVHQLQIRKYEAGEFIKRLKKYLPVFPASRPLNIVLANLYDAVGRRETAIDILLRFIKHREEIGQADDDDVATAWFNLACMYSVDSSKDKNNRKEKLLKEAEGYLLKCLQTANISGRETLAIHSERAKTDPDLDALRKAGIVDRILADFPSTQATSS